MVRSSASSIVSMPVLNGRCTVSTDAQYQSCISIVHHKKDKPFLSYKNVIRCNHFLQLLSFLSRQFPSLFIQNNLRIVKCTAYLNSERERKPFSCQTFSLSMSFLAGCNYDFTRITNSSEIEFRENIFPESQSRIL